MTMDKHFSNPFLAMAAGYDLAALEASFLRRHFQTEKEALNYAVSRQKAAEENHDRDVTEFWKDVERRLLTDPEDNATDLIALIAHVDGFAPRDKWIKPILDDTPCKDFHNQLLTAVEDYGETN